MCRPASLVQVFDVSSWSAPARCPQVVVFVDVTNNWYRERILADDRYAVKNVALLAARAKRAMFEFTPIWDNPIESQRVYRAFGRGPLLDLFMLDMRGYRGPNSDNVQPELVDEARILGRDQVLWLEQQLLASRATWKVIAADMPFGLIVYDDFMRRAGSEAVAQGDGPPLGRELEIAELLRFIRDNDVRNVVWITADVHYCATHYLRPEPSPVPGLQTVLRVRLRPAPRRRLRAERAGQHVRPASRLHQAPAGRPGQRPADRRRPLLRPRQDRRPKRRDDGQPPRRVRRRAVRDRAPTRGLTGTPARRLHSSGTGYRRACGILLSLMIDNRFVVPRRRA